MIYSEFKRGRETGRRSNRAGIRTALFASSMTVLIAGCASTAEPDTALSYTGQVPSVLAMSPQTDMSASEAASVPAIAIRYPARIELAGGGDERETYERLVGLTDGNLTKGAFFVPPDDVTDETDLGSFYIRSTLLKSRLSAHAMQANLREARPDLSVFTEPMVLTVHPSGSGIGDCHIRKKDEDGTASFCLEVEPMSNETPTPTQTVIDIAAFNDYNLTTYGLNKYQSLGLDVTPLVAIGTYSYGIPESGKADYAYYDGLRGSVPDDAARSAFACLFVTCKAKPKGSKMGKSQTMNLSEMNLFDGMRPVSDKVVKSVLSKAGTQEGLIESARMNWEVAGLGAQSPVPALDSDLSNADAVQLLQMESQFRNVYSVQTAELFQSELYHDALDSLNGEEAFVLKLRSANKAKRTDKVMGMLGALTAATGAVAAAGVGDNVAMQQMMGNMDLFLNYSELADVETDLAVMEFSEDARAVEVDLGKITLASTLFEEGLEAQAGSLSELRAVQRKWADTRKAQP